MIVNITNGEVTLKETCTRKLKKEINAAIYGNVQYGTDGTLKGFNMIDKDKGNDIAVLGMVEKIVIGGVEKPTTQETLDELDTKDFEKIFEQVDKLTSDPLPNA